MRNKLLPDKNIFCMLAKACDESLDFNDLVCDTPFVGIIRGSGIYKWYVGGYLRSINSNRGKQKEIENKKIRQQSRWNLYGYLKSWDAIIMLEAV